MVDMISLLSLLYAYNTKSKLIHGLEFKAYEHSRYCVKYRNSIAVKSVFIG